MDAIEPLGVFEALALNHKCCVGLVYVHYHGVIQRNIKSSNIR